MQMSKLRLLKMYLKIKEAREYRHYTVSDLAKLAHISERSINYYETGQKIPRINNVEKIAKALNVDPAWLVGWRNESN